MVETVRSIAEYVDGVVEGAGGVEIVGLAGLHDARPGELSFVASRDHLRRVASTRASALLAPPNLDLAFRPLLRVADPLAAMEALARRWLGAQEEDEEWPREGAVAPDAVLEEGVVLAPGVVIGPRAWIGAGSRLGPGCFVGAGCRIGREARLGAGVVIRARSHLGDRVILHPGVVVGSDGFGFEPGPEGPRKLRHWGSVEIGDDVEIGANSTIDRARFGRTEIGAGTKIDNLVQVAHNVRIGRGCLIAAQVGISGSSILGDGVVVGGQVGFAQHVELGAGSLVAAKAGLSKDHPAGSRLSGAPAQPHREQLKLWVRLRRLDTTLADIERRLRALEEDS